VSAAGPLAGRVPGGARAETLLAYRDLGVAAGGRALIRLTRLGVERGEIVGLVGETGSGKSLTALAAVRLFPSPAMRITGGSVRVDGVEVADRPEREVATLRGRRVGFVFQDPLTALNPVFPVGEPLVRTLRLHLGLGAAAARAEAVERLRQVELPEPEAMLRRYPHELSGGQRQRVLVAIALAGDPRLLLADEPTTALDVTVQAEVVALILRLRAERGLGVLFISHNLALVGKIADRVAVMYAGDVVEEGSAQALLAAPRHPYTRALLAAVPRLGAGAPTAVVGGRPAFRHEVVAGCPFAPRCPLATARCRRDEPPLETRPDGRSVACWRADEAAGLGGEGERA
jgi:oligopeptide/dipeptide ABC transporter ATP-binding protein